MSDAESKSVARRRVEAYEQLLTSLGTEWAERDVAGIVLEKRPDLPEGLPRELDPLTQHIVRCVRGEETFSLPLCVAIAQAFGMEDPWQLYVELLPGEVAPEAALARSVPRAELKGLRAEALKAAVAAAGTSLSAVMRKAFAGEGGDANIKRLRLMSRLSNAQRGVNLLNDEDIALIAPVIGVPVSQLRVCACDGKRHMKKRKGARKPEADEAPKPARRKRKEG